MASTADRVASILSDKKNTRFALAASLVATTNELQALRTEISVLRAELERAAAPRTGRKPPAHFVAAREAAMRLGRSVRVDA